VRYSGSGHAKLPHIRVDPWRARDVNDLGDAQLNLAPRCGSKLKDLATRGSPMIGPGLDNQKRLAEEMVKYSQVFNNVHFLLSQCFASCTTDFAVLKNGLQ
jgi:hypothetical protein